MKDFIARIQEFSRPQLMKLAFDQRQRIGELENKTPESIAIVGMGCRFPGGANSPEAYWELLAEGRDAIRSVPEDRWDSEAWYDEDPDAPGMIGMRSGGFLDRVGEFDPAFFGIAKREARTMDPQQRLLLEVAWEALENAQIAPEHLAGTASGVFVGLCNTDYFQRVLSLGTENIDAYLASGSAPSVAAGRISYCLGLEGPAVTMDTACSSSLVALHTAVRSLRNGECDLALACGVNIICAPETSIALTKAHMLAPDGRCKTFDASADGFARGEGCGVIVLKRLSDAEAAGDNVLALIRGTATNQDGRSGGLTVPNGPAQEAVIRAAVEDAGLAPADIDYVEAHGTGTSLGDPIEVRALANALGEGRAKDAPLAIGSVKTNFGHLESAAGIAGVMKVVLSLQHEKLPQHLHFREPSPHIDWDAFPVRVTAEGMDWQRPETPRRGGVSSFGFSGSNAHVVIEEAPAAKPAMVPARSMQVIPLSARSDAALADLARKYATRLEGGDTALLASVARGAGVGRSHFLHRLCVVADSAATARAALLAAADGKSHPALYTGVATAGERPELVFMCTGQGAQYPGMGRALYAGNAVFRGIIDRCDKHLGADEQGRTLLSVLQDPQAIHEPEWTQPALFAFEVAAAAMWRSFGIEPVAAIGHSLGEYAAACIAGAFSVEEGVSLVAERGKLVRLLPPDGAMAAIFAPIAAVEAAIAPHAERVSIAAINAADSVVISGRGEAVEAVVRDLEAQDIQAHRLKIAFAAHSPLVAPALDAMEAAAAKVAANRTAIPVAWNLSGLSQTAPDAQYWRRHLREPVQFGAGIAALHAQDYRTFLEVGPHPTLVALAQRTLDDGSALLLGTARRDQDEWGEVGASLAQLYVRGAAIDWHEVCEPAAHVRLPTYPFERQTYWVESADSARVSSAPRATAKGGSDPLLGRRLATSTILFETMLRPDAPVWLADHLVRGEVVVAGPAYIAMARACASEAMGRSFAGLADFTVRAPLVLPEEGRTVQVELQPAPGGAVRFAVASLDPQSGSWTRHAEGTLGSEQATAEPVDLAATRSRLGSAEGEAEAFHERLAAIGVSFGPRFRTIAEVRRTEGEALVTLARPSGIDAVGGFVALIDGALQAAGVATPQASDDALYLLSGVGQASLPATLPERMLAHAVIRNAGDPAPDRWIADVDLFAEDGTAIGRLAGVTLSRGQSASTAGLHYKVDWRPAETNASKAFASPADFADENAARFESLAEEQGIAVYDALSTELDAQSTRHIVGAFTDLGFDATTGRTFEESTEAARLGVAASQRRLFGRMLEILADDGLLTRDGSGWMVAGTFPQDDATARYDELLSRFPNTPGELRVLQRCGPELAGVLTGEVDPVRLLFPGGEFAEARSIYVDSPFARAYNGTLTAALKSAIAKLPEGARLRVLEIGAGTGGTTGYVLPELPAERTSYLFTDVSPAFLKQASERFAAYPFLETALLDIERDPAEQGIEPGTFDVVIAANVLHATADLGQTLRHVRQALAPGGLAFLLEGVTRERWIDLTFGLTEGWWRFTDTDLRADHPLVSAADWQQQLAQAGFTDIAAIPGEAGEKPSLQQALLCAQAAPEARKWVLSGGGDFADTLADVLRARGQIVRRGDTAEKGEELVLLDALALADITREDPRGVARCHALTQTALVRLQSFAGVEGARAWIVTRGAQPAAGEQAPGAAWQAPMLGLGRVFALESPSHWGGMVDLPSGDPAAESNLLASVLTSHSAEDQIALRDGSRYVPRLMHMATPAPAPVALSAEASYLVTGGFGGLGGVVARRLAQQGAGRVVLAGRNPDPASAIVRKIEAMGVDVLPVRLDVTDESAVAALADQLAGDGKPLRGIMHAAADLSTGLMADLDESQVSAMLRPKVDGTIALARAAGDLDFLVLFSSTTALLGAAGFGHYAAANAFLDAFAQTAGQQDGRVLSVNWGTWDVMRVASDADREQLQTLGLEPMASDEALEALDGMLGREEPQIVLAKVDWSVMKPLHEARRQRPFLTELGTEAGAAPVMIGGAVSDTIATDGAPTLIERLTLCPESDREDLLIEFVREATAATLGTDAADVGLDLGLFEMGMDSLMSLELKRRLESESGQTLPATLTFNYPNVRALAGYLGKVLVVPEATEPAGLSDDVATAEIDALSDEDLAARLLARLGQVT